MNTKKEIEIDDIEIEQEVKIENRNDLKPKYIMISNENFDKIEYNRNEEIKEDIPDRNIRQGFNHSDFPADINLDVNNENFENSENIAKFKVPLSLKKTFLCSMFLFAVGITLIILGSIQQIAAADPGKGITFWVLGSIVLIPGGYYTYQFYKARKARTYDERQEILDEIPEL